MLLELIRPALARIDARDVRQLQADLPVRQIETPGLMRRNSSGRRAALARAKRQIIRDLLRASPVVYITHADHPTDYDVPGPWTEVARRTWRIPGLDVESPTVDHWLFSLGNWIISVAADPILPDWQAAMFREAVSLLEWTREIGIEVLISSGPDDSDWVVAVSP